MFKHLSYFVVSTIFCIFLSNRSFAEEQSLPLIPLPSVTGYALGDGWAGAFGLKVESSPVYHGSEENIVEVKLEGAVQWRRGAHSIFLEGSDIDGLELGWRGLVQLDWFMQAGAKHETVLPSGDTTTAGIKDFPHRGSHIFGFLESKYSLGADWRSWVSGRISVGPASFGYRGLIEVGHRFGHKLDGSGIEISFYSSFADDVNLNNYFGITASDTVASGIEQTDLDGGYRSTGLNLIYRKTIIDNIQMTLDAGVEIYSHNIKESALVSDSPEASIATSVLWVF